MDKYLSIVNNDNDFNEDYFKENFSYVAFTVKKPDTDQNGNIIPSFIESETKKALEGLLKEMEKAHIVHNVNSAGRTVEAQQSTINSLKKEAETDINNGKFKLLDNETVEEAKLRYAKKYALMPGKSEHHTGLAVDVSVRRDTSKIKSKLIKRIINKLDDINYAKMATIAIKHGFIVRYTPGNFKACGVNGAEAWHLRYVGLENAKQIAEKMKKDETYNLEKYVEELKQKEIQTNI